MKRIIIRKAKEKDILNIFLLRNSDSVRMNCINNEKIILKEHEDWIKNKLDKFYIIEFNKEWAGYYWLNDNDEISIYIEEKFRGNGIAKEVLKNLNGKAIILSHNLGSLHCFIKSGWKLKGYYLEK